MYVLQWGLHKLFSLSLLLYVSCEERLVPSSPFPWKCNTFLHTAFPCSEYYETIWLPKVLWPDLLSLAFAYPLTTTCRHDRFGKQWDLPSSQMFSCSMPCIIIPAGSGHDSPRAPQLILISNLRTLSSPAFKDLSKLKLLQGMYGTPLRPTTFAVYASIALFDYDPEFQTSKWPASSRCTSPWQLQHSLRVSG